MYACHASPAICLDLVPSYDADSCIHSLRRFFSRRGVPSSMLSDNGTSFIASETQQFTANLGIRWNFNPPASPWWGGMFERLIRSSKRCLRKILLKAKLSFNELQTILSELEMVINNRPLTFTNEEPGDKVIPPNHLLFGRRINLHAIVTNGEDIGTTVSNNRRFIYLKNLVDSFWLRWSKEYLTKLREHNGSYEKCHGNPCQVGDVVLIQQDHSPRMAYRTGVIESFKPSSDSLNRVAIVRYLQSGNHARMTRPVNKLFPIECRENKVDSCVDITFVEDSNISKIVDNFNFYA